MCIKYILTSQEAKEVDRHTIEDIGIPSLVLMERAALSVVQEIEKIANENSKILCVCGTGNNGGDGIAIARILCQKGYQVSCSIIGDLQKCSQDNLRQQQIAQKVGVDFRNNPSMQEYTIIVDAIFGIGLSRVLEGTYADCVAKINSSTAVKVAVDIASGVHTDTGQIMGVAVDADVTITFAYAKRGHLFYPGAECCGRLVIADIGFDEQSENWKTFFYASSAQKELLPKRKAYSNKGTYGKVLIIAGSKGMSGAGFLSALGAYRMGAGLVKIVSPEENRAIYQTLIPEAVLFTYDCEHLQEKKEVLINEIVRATAIVIGPGIGLDENAKYLLSLVLAHAKCPVVIDADALTLLSKMSEYITPLNGDVAKWNLSEQFILTPHLKEMTTLLGAESSISNLQKKEIDVQNICRENKCILILKDARTVVIQGEKCYINVSGNSGMATGGSGDVLTGVVAGLLAQGCEPFEAASKGVFFHGKAGDRVAEEKGEYAVMAKDIANYIAYEK